MVLAGVRWDFLWQRHQEISTRLAARGHPTIFVETTGLSTPRSAPGLPRKLLARLSRFAEVGEPLNTPENLSVYSPLVAPPTARPFRLLNRRLLIPRTVRDLHRIAKEDPAVISYPPTRTTLDIIQRLLPSRLLYDCSDDYENFPGAPRDIAETERELLQRADAVSCTSEFLLEKARKVRPDAFLCGPGVDFKAFNDLATELEPGSEARTVCFFGHVGGRLDLDVLREVARAGFTVRLIGEAENDARWLLNEPNVDYRGVIPHSDLPAALSGVDAFVLPYRLTGAGPGISPAKTYECLATGKPVISIPLPAFIGLGEHVYLARGPEEFVERLRDLTNTETVERAIARVDLARENDWERRIDELVRALDLAR